MSELPPIRWGIVTTGMISEWFVTDLLKPSWPGKSANHIIQAIGGSTLQKSQDFTAKFITPTNPDVKPTLYGSYQEIYADANVDCVYIGTPHSFHKQNCLDAIAAGKNVLCEKPFAMTAQQAAEVFKAAEEKGVFVMEAMWTRFFPLVKKLQHLLFVEKKLGRIYRTFCDFGMDLDIRSLPEGNRYTDPALGAGSLLDIGIYSLTWGIVSLTDKVGDEAEEPEVFSTQTIEHRVDTASSVLLKYPSTGRQAICTSTTNYPRNVEFARIEGSEGHITVHSTDAPSAPEYFIFHPKKGNPERYDFEKPGRGFWWEADAVAHDIHAGRKQNATIPWSETMRMMRIMDGVRQRGGARFPVDNW